MTRKSQTHFQRMVSNSVVEDLNSRNLSMLETRETSLNSVTNTKMLSNSRPRLQWEVLSLNSPHLQREHQELKTNLKVFRKKRKKRLKLSQSQRVHPSSLALLKAC